MAKAKGNNPVYKKRMTEEEKKNIEIKAEEEKKKRKNIVSHSTFIVAFMAVFLLVSFVGRWVLAVQNGYYKSIVLVDDSVSDALNGAVGLDPGRVDGRGEGGLDGLLDVFLAEGFL